MTYVMCFAMKNTLFFWFYPYLSRLFHKIRGRSKKFSKCGANWCT